MASFSLSIIEIIVLMVGAITLGFTIHFFVSNRSTMKNSPMETAKVSKTLEDWKLRYFNDTESRDKQLAAMRKLLAESEENNEINTIEAEEMRKENKRLKLEAATRQQTPVTVTSAQHEPDYIFQLRQAQSNLLEHNEKVNLLIGQIDIVAKTEERQQAVQQANQQLSGEVDELRRLLSQMEKEMTNSKQKEQLTTEMTSMIDSTYNEFNALQEKIHKLEEQLRASRDIHLDHEDLKEGHSRVTQDFEEQRRKYLTAVSDNKQLIDDLNETEDKLRESNFQRQNLQKRVAYLEELHSDIQSVSDTNKKLEGQIRRIGELESLLNVVEEERDQLARKHIN